MDGWETDSQLKLDAYDNSQERWGFIVQTDLNFIFSSFFFLMKLFKESDDLCVFKIIYQFGRERNQKF